MTEQALTILKQQYGTEFGADAVKIVASELNTSYATLSKYLQQYKVGRGKWNLEATVQDLEDTYNSPSSSSVATMNSVVQNLIPQKDDTFVNFGNFTDIKKVIQSRLFYPTFITGLSGNGKTFGVEQACAQLGRELIRVNITIETDEDDLIGGFRLVNGNTVWHNGPVIEALERVLFSFLMRLTLPLTRFSVSRAFLKVRVSSLRRLVLILYLPMVSM